MVFFSTLLTLIGRFRDRTIAREPPPGVVGDLGTAVSHPVPNLAFRIVPTPPSVSLDHLAPPSTVRTFAEGRIEIGGSGSGSRGPAAWDGEALRRRRRQLVVRGSRSVRP